MASTHSDGDDLDLTGLVESIVDSDEEDDLTESMDVSKQNVYAFHFFFVINKDADIPHATYNRITYPSTYLLPL